MNLRALLAAAGAMLAASACAPGAVVTPPHAAAANARSAAQAASAAVANDAAPGPLVVFPNAVNGGGFPGSTTAYVSFPTFANVDRTLTVTSSNPAVARPIAATITIPAGQNRGGVQVIVSSVASETHATITVSGGGVSQSADVGVFPQFAALPPSLLASVKANPLTVPAGTTGNITVTLAAPAPAGGLTLAVFAGPSDWGDIEPPTVTVPAGAVTVNVPVLTFAGFPNSTTTLDIKVLAGDAPVVTGLNVVAGGTTAPPPVSTPPPPVSTPAPSVPLAAPSPASPAADARFSPGATVGFDWNDVAGAATYTLEVSATDKFTSFIVNRTVTASAFSTTSLPASTLFWRVRANAASGAAGAWSATRRLEVK